MSLDNINIILTHRQLHDALLTAQPTITEEPVDVAFNVGDTFDLSCLVDANGATVSSVNWYKDDVQLDFVNPANSRYTFVNSDRFTSGDHAIRITDAVAAEDVAMFHCGVTATSFAEVVSQKASLTVYVATTMEATTEVMTTMMMMSTGRGGGGDGSWSPWVPGLDKCCGGPDLVRTRDCLPLGSTCVGESTETLTCTALCVTKGEIPKFKKCKVRKTNNKILTAKFCRQFCMRGYVYDIATGKCMDLTP
ncbi:PREDICTED: uncharacterized protein LOC106820031 [Priapulus caudatus]|uniref:Uncharacterized protein LOC106820031 n=1 Tax=Priapulus caudatus TaxID=37621 RepID=A0ABM1F6K3_PRICU|nr:PREDICTED: uncharacterized protein LOC106820031 [Priapulus caudatus]